MCYVCKRLIKTCSFFLFFREDNVARGGYVYDNRLRTALDSNVVTRWEPCGLAKRRNVHTYAGSSFYTLLYNRKSNDGGDTSDGIQNIRGGKWFETWELLRNTGLFLVIFHSFFLVFIFFKNLEICNLAVASLFFYSKHVGISARKIE